MRNTNKTRGAYVDACSFNEAEGCFLPERHFLAWLCKELGAMLSSSLALEAVRNQKRTKYDVPPR